MSRDEDGNPSDDAMDADAMRDVPAAIGSIRHAPKLSRESRAINPRALLAAEAAGQSREPELEDVYGYDSELPPPPPPPRRPQRERPREHSTLPRGMPRVVPPPVQAPPVPRAPLFGTALTSQREVEDRQAWDAYAAAALQGMSAGNILESYGHSAVISWAAELADAMLAERRARFGG